MTGVQTCALPISLAFGIEHLVATEPESRGGRFTGRVAGTPCFREGKIARLDAWLAGRGTPLASFSRSTFYSDSHNDLPLLERVTHPVAVDPDASLAAEAARLEIGGRRILEVGCGLALPSLVLAGRGADITATDYHPLAGEFLERNARENGVPAISFKAGRDLVKGGEAEGKRVSDEYNEKRYHQPADEYSPSWDLSGQAQDMNLLYSLGRAMANSRTWPEWLQGSEFKAERDKTASQRR